MEYWGESRKDARKSIITKARKDESTKEEIYFEKETACCGNKS
jgi:hypothetical protein